MTWLWHTCHSYVIAMTYPWHSCVILFFVFFRNTIDAVASIHFTTEIHWTVSLFVLYGVPHLQTENWRIGQETMDQCCNCVAYWSRGLVKLSQNCYLKSAKLRTNLCFMGAHILIESSWNTRPWIHARAKPWSPIAFWSSVWTGTTSCQRDAPNSPHESLSLQSACVWTCWNAS